MQQVMARLRIATWNINSLRLRLPLLRRLVDHAQPDVICLQETKVPDLLFPENAPAELGYPFHLRRGMKGYNGVAVLSRTPIGLLQAPDWCARDDSRHLAVSIEAPGGPIAIHNFYVPAGGDVPDSESNPKFRHKLDFIAEVTDWFEKAGPIRRTVLLGDLNVAPLEHDVWSHKQLLSVVSHTPIEVAAMSRWRRCGFVDAIRHLVPEPTRLYTWWSYRNRDWRASNRGRRLDHAWVSQDLIGAIENYHVLIEARDWPQTSDHVPIWIDIVF